MQELRAEKLQLIAEEMQYSDQLRRTFSGGEMTEVDVYKNRAALTFTTFLLEGVQEYIEALTFFHFLKGETIPNRDSSALLCTTEVSPRISSLF